MIRLSHSAFCIKHEGDSTDQLPEPIIIGQCMPSLEDYDQPMTC